MAISRRRRKALKPSDFAYPKQRKYPIDTRARARNALARAAQSHTSGTYEGVRRKVAKKYPGLVRKKR